MTGQLRVKVTDDGGNTSIGTARIAITDDGDEVSVPTDNCPDAANPGQDDADSDGVGDACDPDSRRPMIDKPGVFPADDPASVAKSEISGAVFIDEDGDRAPDPGEKGVSGVVVRLTGADAGGEKIDRSVRSDASGAWRVDRLPPGAYRLAASQAAGYRDGPDAAGSVRRCAAGASAGAAGEDQMAEIVLSGIGCGATGYAFTEKPAGGVLRRFGHWAPFGAVAVVAAAVTFVAVTAALMVRRRRRKGGEPWAHSASIDVP
jgi:hypothetical protein